MYERKFKLIDRVIHSEYPETFNYNLLPETANLFEVSIRNLVV